MSEIVSTRFRLQDTADPAVNLLEFLPEGPGTDFLHKKRVPGGLLSAPSILVAAVGPVLQEAGSPAFFSSLPHNQRAVSDFTLSTILSISLAGSVHQFCDQTR